MKKSRQKRNPFEKLKKEEEPKKVILRIQRISRNGVVKIEFNQRLQVPAFIDRPSSPGTQEAETRELIPLSSLDVSRDIFEFVFVLKSDVQPEDINYFLEVTKWNEYGMDVFVNFTNPLLISRGKLQDEVICKIKNKGLFMSYDGTEVLRSERIYKG